MWLLIFLFAPLWFALLSIVWYSCQNGISPMPTSPKVKKLFLQTLPTNITGPIKELGAGWGTLAFALAKKYPHNHVTAYENSLFPYWFCQCRLWLYPHKNLCFVRKDFYIDSFHDTALLTCYLFPGAMKKLKSKLEEELSPKAMVATHTFAIPNWTPLSTATVNDLYHTRIYLYIEKGTAR